VTPSLEIRRFAQEQAARRLDRIVSEVKHILQLPPAADESVDAVHDFRVATRRFRAVLDTFPDFFPKAERRKVRKAIRTAFALAGEVRNHDIAMSLIQESPINGPVSVTQLLRQDRVGCERRLRGELRVWVRRDFSARWRKQLNLS
jgi:hypothetical protein